MNTTGSGNSLHSNGLMMTADMNSSMDTMSVDDSIVDNSDEDNASVSTHASAQLANRETTYIAWLRQSVTSALAVAAVVVSVSVYTRAAHAQSSHFRQSFDDAAAQLTAAAPAHVATSYAAVRALAVDVRSYAAYSSNGDSSSIWPAVALPDFGERAAATLEVAQAASLLFVPLVDAVALPTWEPFSVAHQDWLENEADKEASPSLWKEPAVTARRLSQEAGIAAHVFDFQGAVTGDGPFMPLWQTYPQHANLTTWVNLDLGAVDRLAEGMQVVRQTHEAVVARVLNEVPVSPGAPPEPVQVALVVRALLGSRSLAQTATAHTEPVSPLMVPVVQDEKVVGLVLALLEWRGALAHVLSPRAQGVVAVLDYACDEAPTTSYTYQVNGGDVVYLGAGDLHEAHFHAMGHHVSLTSTAGCSYVLQVYPSQHMKNSYVTHGPFWSSTLVVLVFLLAYGVFWAYDFLVEQRQKVVMDQALQSTAIVSSLFPEAVRDRLFNETDDDDTPHRRRSSDGHGGSFFSEPPKMRLNSFLDENGEPQSGPANKPIADLFPHCTVLFADISGFTAWSSLRDPAQVFTLLESIYHSFDQIARKRGVFKVETIGDSYVAVTGLPDPQEDHAVIMARFARDCNVSMKEVTRKLELTLGPDTGDLRMRSGLHSGPVTAGVLRGERSRFQLFGDTVNTAARMESNGQRDRIQCSQSTADILTEAGKGHWLKKRDEMVHAKGKGNMQTYWVEVSSSRRDSNDLSTQSGDGVQGKSEIWGANSEIPEVVTARAKHQRLIDYNVDLLAQHLKRVMARRRVLAIAGRRCSQGGHAPKVHAPSTDENEDGKTVLDEVTEVIRLPQFDARSFKQTVDPESIELDAKVMSQLKRYVTIIGAMYRQNPFHNFEHASHVVMSVNKLLQRVVTKENTMFKKNSKKTKQTSQEIASELHNYTFGITSDPLTQFAILFSALIHDADHFGVSNNQLIKEGAPMADKYKGKSVAEQNSVDMAWDLLMDPDEYPDLQKCIFATDGEYQRFRQVVVNVVMATDIFDPELSALRKQRWDKAFDPNQSDEEDENRKATIVIEHIMQASDVAHTMQHWHVYQKWNRRLFDELYTAFKAGRFDVDPCTFWYKGEMKFFDGYVIPLAKKLKDCGVFGVSSDECLNYATNNRKEWEAKGEMITEELKSNYNKREKEENERKAKEAEAGGGGGGRNKKKSRFARRRSLFTAGG